MKKSIILLIILVSQILISCNPKPDIDKILKDQETKERIFKSIAEDHEYMTEFIKTMHNNEHAMQMMMHNDMMMNNMMGNKNIMHQIMNDSIKIRNMLQIMHQKGIISNECLQSCMKNMSTKKISDDKK
ncbi:hypothetical protein [Tenacibaculum caenipelagi]|uniref:Lipoprotein n=1 Tax=Tenacibaculum caenipelagi TaxID=1325435 RepID=A0A4R6TAM8_9FLAO|nr:hypothetical protein [Tenacibaculum caenipelagi]TDQ21949.1 hypothetical protein DFQ07_3046 [Tenacibaculum caenipelagi]